MTRTPIDIFKLLPGTNCGECGVKTCMAFAGSVFSGQKHISGCRYLAKEVIDSFATGEDPGPEAEKSREQVMGDLKRKITELSLGDAAKRLGYSFRNERITFKILGKDFSVDSHGNFYTDIHINPWVVLPVVTHLMEGKGTKPKGNWVSLRELAGGKTWEKFFNHKCVMPMKKLADTFPGLFEDIIRIFSGKQASNHHGSDISLVIHPLPLLPILICYWKPEDGLSSSLNIFFDITASDNLDVKAIYGLVAGLVTMFENIVQRHGV